MFDKLLKSDLFGVVPNYIPSHLCHIIGQLHFAPPQNVTQVMRGRVVRNVIPGWFAK